MRIKFIKIDETERGLETRGKKATGKVSRAVTGHVVTPRGGRVGVDDDPANPTKNLKAMVRRSYKAKAENSSTEILGNKIVEGEVKARNKELKREFQAKSGEKTEGFRGTSGYAANFAKRYGADEEGAKKAAAVARGRAASDSQVYATPRGSNRRARQLAHQERVAAQAAKKVNASTEILGNKIVEGFNRLIEEYTGKDDPQKAKDYASPEAQAARRARDERRLAALKTKQGEKKSTEKVGKLVTKVRKVRGQGNPGEPGFISGVGRRSAISKSINAENRRRGIAGHGPAETSSRKPKGV
jgi:hypothetical protein